MGHFSLSTHKNFIRFIISQAGVNPSEYYQYLVNWVRKHEFNNGLDNLFYSLRLTSYEMSARDFDRLPFMIRK